ncbi:ATP-binding cassette sub-family B member 8, mitochondrial [Smittium mucronatum]|uniref:Mitochondrial potassium channel ATP-binding subunit n=1 Tax=Smittium mucronatum TaxID=133383 RepID=A0A1R0H266_9FUNG|nr:ATP-binding cassette sub-family B member 8, mitochondrial [Smittium mucronatum]
MFSELPKDYIFDSKNNSTHFGKYDNKNEYARTRFQILADQYFSNTKSAREVQDLDLLSQGISALEQIKDNETKPEIPDKIYRKDSTLSSILRYILPEYKILLGVILTAVGAAAANLLIPVITGQLINVISSSLAKSASDVSSEIPLQLLGDLIAPSKKLFLAFLASSGLTFCHIYFVSLLGETVANRLKIDIFSNIMSKNLDFFESPHHKSSDLVNVLTSDINEFKSALKMIITQGLKSSTLAIGAIIQLYRISPQLTSLLTMTIPVAYLGLWVYGDFLRALQKSIKKWDLIELSVANESINNIKTVKSFCNENIEVSLYDLASKNVADSRVAFGFHFGMFRAFSNFTAGGLLLVVLCYGGHLVSTGDISAGDLMAYVMSVQSAQKAIDSLGVLMGQSLKATTSTFRIIELLPSSGKRSSTSGLILKNGLKGQIRFMDVGFSYPSRPESKVIEHFDLSIDRGQIVALCGLSGSGKSTVASLLCKLHEPTFGNIWIDREYPLAKVDGQWYRSQIGLIDQSPAIFQTSIMENIRYGNINASDDDCVNAAKSANAYDFICSFPDQFNTVLGGGGGSSSGVNLSGGQLQRLAIARAIVRNPKILVLDEATSALDSDSEGLVQKALEKVMLGKTVLIIAHRLSTIRNADKIVVMGKLNGAEKTSPGGKILEVGNHDELMKNKKGIYYKMYNHAAENSSSTID